MKNSKKFKRKLSAYVYAPMPILMLKAVNGGNHVFELDDFVDALKHTPEYCNTQRSVIKKLVKSFFKLLTDYCYAKWDLNRLVLEDGAGKELCEILAQAETVDIAEQEAADANGGFYKGEVNEEPESPISLVPLEDDTSILTGKLLHQVKSAKFYFAEAVQKMLHTVEGADERALIKKFGVTVNVNAYGTTEEIALVIANKILANYAKANLVSLREQGHE